MARARTQGDLTDRQEQFAVAVAGGAALADAYRAAYSTERMKDKSVWEKASRLAAQVKVRARIAQLTEKSQQKAIDTLAIDKEMIMRRLLRNAERMGDDVPVAVQDEDGNTKIEVIPPSPAHIQASNRALELLGKEIGMFIDRKEIRTGSLDTMNERELQEYIAQLDAALGGDPHADTRH